MLRISLLLFLALSGLSCSGEETKVAPAGPDYAGQRRAMVDSQIVARGVTDSLVVAAMLKTPRHLFVPDQYRGLAYADQPLPIGEDQTISQPYIVALMTELLALKGGEKVLEIGTGSGYQAAVLAGIAGEVYSIEILQPLASSAAKRLDSLGYKNVRVMCGDGYKGWPDKAPFDGIVVTAAPDHVPLPLKEQLRVGAHLVIPVGDLYQELMVITKTDSGYVSRSMLPVRFVPMTGEAQEKKAK